MHMHSVYEFRRPNFSSAAERGRSECLAILDDRTRDFEYLIAGDYGYVHDAAAS